jgi:CheY-like chemotaxis protein/anti-sigma regulatory factor (Ser/Thr protein kinase)
LKRILVVDDNPSEREGLCRLLERSGLAAKAVEDGFVALQMIEREKFDLLLLDVWMPRMDGLELLSLLPDDPPPKAIMITGDDKPETLLQSLREKAYLFVGKPFDPKYLIEMVKTALESESLPGDIRVVSAQPNWVELRFPCELQTASRIENVIEHLGSSLPPQIRQSLGLAFHELLMNAIEWGGQLNPALEARIDYLHTRKFLMCRISDPGRGFNPSGMDHSVGTNMTVDPLALSNVRAEKGMRPGGYGIQLALSLVDELVYNEAHNEVVMVKYLNQ